MGQKTAACCRILSTLSPLPTERHPTLMCTAPTPRRRTILLTSMRFLYYDDWRCWCCLGETPTAIVWNARRGAADRGLVWSHGRLRMASVWLSSLKKGCGQTSNLPWHDRILRRPLPRSCRIYMDKRPTNNVIWITSIWTWITSIITAAVGTGRRINSVPKKVITVGNDSCPLS